MTPFNEKEKKEKRYQNDQWVDLSPDFKPMSLCTQAWVVVSRWAGGGGGGGLKSELSMTCWKGHSSVTPPLNILLNDVPRLLTPADKARKHNTVRSPPTSLSFIFSRRPPCSHSPSLTAPPPHSARSWIFNYLTETFSQSFTAALQVVWSTGTCLEGNFYRL